MATLTDVYLFGEAGLFGACRAADGAPASILPGPHGAPRDVRDVVDRGRNPADAEGNTGVAGTDGCRGNLCTGISGRVTRWSRRGARSRRYRLCRAARPFDRRDRHHRAASGHHGRRRLPVSVAGPAGMGQAARTGRSAHGAAGSA